MLASRTGIAVGLTGLLLLAGASSVHDASATGDTRTLSFHHTHSNENLTITFKRNGRYDETALKSLNHFLRDWRSQEQTKMDPHLFDILWEVYRDVDAKQPIQIISSYRSPGTNAMLRRRSSHSGVARHSQHTLGRAMDFFIPGVALEKIRFAGLRLQRGGVGFYPTSGSPFVHLDTGSIRHWPRMNHDQLVRVFPNGRTVHVPSNGKPLPGYQLALADVAHRKDNTTTTMPSLLASLFSGKQSAEEDDESRAAPPAAKATADTATANSNVMSASVAASAAASKVKLAEVKLAEAVPMPRAKPVRAVSYQLASAAPQEVVLKPQPVKSRVVPASAAKPPQTPADIINARAFWDDDFASPTPASPAQIAALHARNAAADPQATASLPANVSEAMAFAPALDRSKLVVASAPLPVSVRTAARASKTHHGQSDILTTMAKVTSSGQTSEAWLRAMIHTPDANTSLSSTILGDQDLAVMSAHFVKPNRAVSMTFSNDPLMGLVCARFTGSATARLAVTTFTQRTAALR